MENSIKKIAIFGSYNGASIGDTAILLGLLSSIERIYGSYLEVNVFVMSRINIKNECKLLGIELNVNEIVITEFEEATSPFLVLTNFFKKISNKVIKRFVKESRVRSVLRNVDYLLIGGGNLIMDLYPRWPSLIKEICGYAILENVKYSFVGIGAGPITTELGANTFLHCLRSAEYIYCRDNSSVSLISQLGIENVFLMPDLALGLKVPDSILGQGIKKYLLFNVASVYGQDWPITDQGKFESYINNLADLAERLIDLGEFEKLVVFYSNYPSDREGGEKFIKQMEKRNTKTPIIVEDDFLTVKDIIELSSSAKLTVITRLHAGIMAYYGCSSIIGICYQPKVKNVLESSGISNIFFDIDSFYIDDKIISDITNSIQSSTKDKVLKETSDTIDKCILKIISPCNYK